MSIWRKWYFLLLSSLTLAGALGVLAARATAGLPPVPPEAAPTAVHAPTAVSPHRETSAAPDSPDISFIDSPNPTCHVPDPGTGICYVQWGYLYVTAAPGAYVISMTVTIDDHLRAYHAGFFQTAMYIPADMTAPGYRVACGAPGSGGAPDLGSSYSYAIRARETTGLTAANYGTVSCPADLALLYLPVIRRHP
ncbi:MAG: hypothetical protein KC425_15675 [Anaerolineales bacterium]|nr:hypothetical protein [Anaerolineales bacterium]